MLADPDGSGLYNKVSFAVPLTDSLLLLSSLVIGAPTWLRGSTVLQLSDPSRAERFVRSYLIPDCIVCIHLPQTRSNSTEFHHVDSLLSSGRVARGGSCLLFYFTPGFLFLMAN